MAELFPNEGLDFILGIFPNGSVPPTSLQLRCFSNFSATTVLGTAQGTANITESVWTNYSAQTIGTADWGDPAAGANGKKVTASQYNMGTCGATGGTVNGFYITANAGATCVCMANFDDATAVVMQQNDILKITPTIEIVG